MPPTRVLAKRFLTLVTTIAAILVSADVWAQGNPASCDSFTDDPVVASVTPVKAVHVSELRTCLDDLLAQRSLPAVNWTDSDLTLQVVIKAVHFTELRSALDDVYTAGGVPTPPYTDTLTAGVTVIRAVHVNELRSAIADAPPPCSYSVSPSSLTVGPGNQTGTFDVIASASGCTWTASTQDEFLHITSPSSGTGNGTVDYGIDSNTTDEARTGSFLIAGLTVSVTQQAAMECSFSVSPDSFVVGPENGNGTVNVTATPGCAWIASSQAGFLHITAGSSGSGDGTVEFSIENYTGSGSRSGSLTVAGRTVTVTQEGVSSSGVAARASSP